MDKEQETKSPDKDSLLLIRLILTFQSAAMQQMGKVADPVSGKIERNLPEASVSIDTLTMLRSKCKESLNEDEKRFLTHVISELQLNYIDEINRIDHQTGTGNAEPTNNQTETTGAESSA